MEIVSTVVSTISTAYAGCLTPDLLTLSPVPLSFDLEQGSGKVGLSTHSIMSP